jgi:hypothetical protein
MIGAISLLHVTAAFVGSFLSPEGVQAKRRISAEIKTFFRKDTFKDKAIWLTKICNFNHTLFHHLHFLLSHRV